MFLSLYKKLFKKHGKQNWWPISNQFKPAELEICVGTILTQNTSWKNVEKALTNLKKQGLLTAEDIIKTDTKKLEKAIKPSGFYKQKAQRLKTLCKFILTYKGDFYKQVEREELLSLKGVGKETADSILLYACNKPFFVIDTYTRRLLSFIGLIKGDEDYDKIQKLCESKLPKDIKLYQEFHALIVEEGKLSPQNSNRKVF